MGGGWNMEPHILKESLVPDNLKMKVLHGCGDIGSCVAGKTTSLIDDFFVSRDLSDVATKAKFNGLVAARPHRPTYLPIRVRPRNVRVCVFFCKDLRGRMGA